jgi:hypothetical protein
MLSAPGRYDSPGYKPALEGSKIDLMREILNVYEGGKP